MIQCVWGTALPESFLIFDLVEPQALVLCDQSRQSRKYSSCEIKGNKRIMFNKYIYKKSERCGLHLYSLSLSQQFIEPNLFGLTALVVCGYVTTWFEHLETGIFA